MLSLYGVTADVVAVWCAVGLCGSIGTGAIDELCHVDVRAVTLAAR